MIEHEELLDDGGMAVIGLCPLLGSGGECRGLEGGRVRN